MFHRVIQIVVVAGLLVGGVTTGELYRNEGLRARLAWESHHHGEWLVPMLYGEPWLTKPPGTSWLVTLCSLPWGKITPWSARLPSVVAAFAAVVMVGWLVGRTFDQRLGWLVAVMLPCSPAWLDRVPSAEIDMIQLGWVTASMVCLIRAVDSERITWWLAALLCVTGGFFTKWTAPAFFYLTLIPLLCWRGQLRTLVRWPHLVSAGMVILLAVGWLTLVVQRVGWNVVFDTVSQEALSRLSPSHHPRPYPWHELLTFPLTFVAMCLPWSLVAIPAMLTSYSRSLDNDRQRLVWQACLVWLISSLVFWTIVPGHRPRHVLPAQPAVAILAALACWQQVRFWKLAHGLVAVWVVVKIVWVGAILPQRGGALPIEVRAEQIARFVPSDDALHLAQLKDECLTFYYGRPVIRSNNLPTHAGAWCLLTEQEWRERRVEMRSVLQLTDSQLDPIRLVQVERVKLRPTIEDSVCTERARPENESTHGSDH